MRKITLLLTSFLFSGFTILAQEGPPPPPAARERIESLKVGFLTERLNLSADEAKVFWPVYNKFQDELEQLRKSRRENLMNARLNFDEMSDAEVEKTVDNELMFRQNELDVLKKYNPQFKKVLPVKKVAKLYKAEEDFKRKLIDMIQDRKDDRRQEKKQLRNGN
ncbi:MAG TPA: hypothetical protein PLU53_13645 [Bacteroidia bacterium]|nr:hypothetical protein [Bacteroidia bacterium]